MKGNVYLLSLLCFENASNYEPRFKASDEDEPRIFPTISNQKYNSHLKEVGKLAGMTGD